MIVMTTIRKKALPIGVEFFDDMIMNDYYYVDKTLLIKDILEKKGIVSLFTRPRRFGKSLNISMLQCFFDNLMKAKAPIFDGLKIIQAGDEYLGHQNKYPVIKLGLKDVSASDFATAIEMLILEIASEFSRHQYLLNSEKLDNSDKELYNLILTKKAKITDYRNSLKFLSNCLEKHYDQKVIILIDEYDVPLEKAHFKGYYDEMVEFIRGFFSVALKTNESLQFAVLTGCLRVSKESIFTGLNNLHVISVLDDNFGEYFGFTEAEASQLLEYYGVSDKLADMRDWYNGYLFGETVVYNPWSSIKYLYDIIYNKMETKRPYWSNTSSNIIIKDLIAEADINVKNEIELLIAGGTITKPIVEDIVYGEIKEDMDNLWSFLFFTGYLKKISKKQIGVHNHIELAIPNKEIKYIYENQITKWFKDQVVQADLRKMYQAILTGDAETFQTELSEMLQASISYFDSKEEFYHGFLTAMMVTMGGYITKSNRESGNGRADIFMRPVSIRQPAVIIEVKITKEAKDLETDAEVALKQIEEKKYDDELKREGYREIIKYGIAFYRKDCEIKPFPQL